MPTRTTASYESLDSITAMPTRTNASYESLDSMTAAPSIQQASYEYCDSMTAISNDQSSVLLESVRSAHTLWIYPGEEPNEFDFDFPPVLNTLKTTTLLNDICMKVSDKDTASFNRILKAIRFADKSKKTVAAVIAVSKLSLSAEVSEIVTAEITKLLRCTHECSQTTAAKYLAERKQTDDVWGIIMIETLKAAANISDGSRSTSRAKSFRNLINRAIAASPRSAATAILQLFSASAAPLHISVN